jgi:farnesyl diphosphate synthase
MLDAVLTLLAAAWGAAIRLLIPEAQQLPVAALALVTLAAARFFASAPAAVGAIGPAVDASKVTRRPYPVYNISSSEAKKASFSKIIPILIDEACDELEQSYEVRPDEVAWIRNVLEYNVVGGKMNRGLMVVESGVLLFESQGTNATNDDLCRFAVLGWVIEMLQAWLLIADDIMDSSVTRRGRPCWYRRDGLGSAAINDAFLVEMILFKALRRHFGDRPEYSKLVDLVMETTLQTELGQLLDIKCDTAPLQAFTLDRWTAIVKYKTAFYSFYLPVAMAMVCAGLEERSEYDAAREILVVMGVYFQAQDDFLDAFGTPEQIGKIGTDIQDKKCGWLFVNAYHSMVDATQKKYLDKHYGNCSVGSKEEKKIKAMYKDIGLKAKYHAYEEASYAQIMQLKGSVSSVPWAVFETFLKKVYKRKK